MEYLLRTTSAEEVTAAEPWLWHEMLYTVDGISAVDNDTKLVKMEKLEACIASNCYFALKLQYKNKEGSVLKMKTGQEPDILNQNFKL